jgi:hypothetical protein
MGESMTVHRTKGGRVEIAGDPPPVHEFSARWIARYLGDLVDVDITVNTTDGPTVYRLERFALVGYDESGEPRWNFTGLRGRLLGEDGQVATDG